MEQAGEKRGEGQGGSCLTGHREDWCSLMIGPWEALHHQDCLLQLSCPGQSVSSSSSQKSSHSSQDLVIISASPCWGLFTSWEGFSWIGPRWPHQLSFVPVAHIWSKGDTQVSLPRPTLGVCGWVPKLQKYLLPAMVGAASQPISPCLLAFQAGIQHGFTLSPESQRMLTKLFPWSPLHCIWEETWELLTVPPGRDEVHSTSMLFFFPPKLIFSTNSLLQSLKARVFYALNVGVGEKFEFHNKFLDLPLKMCFFFWHQIVMSCLLYHGASGKTFNLTSFYIYFASFIGELPLWLRR